MSNHSDFSDRFAGIVASFPGFDGLRRVALAPRRKESLGPSRRNYGRCFDCSYTPFSEIDTIFWGDDAVRFQVHSEFAIMTQPLPVRLQEPLSAVSESTRECITRLVGACSQGHSLSPGEYSGVTVAAVLILLFEQGGRLRVLLTTRSKSLRAHPGQTALPGGKVDADDEDEIATALREAREEINLVDVSAVHFLCTLPPFISQWKLLVHPIVMFLTDISILDTLAPNPDEVDRIFTHPLDAIIDPPLASGESLSGIGSEDWPYEGDYYHPSDTCWSGIPFRMHRFRSASTPIKGLTADILILTAELAFHKGPTFDKLAPGQPSREEIVQWGLSEGQEGHVKRLSNSLHVANHERTNAGISREEAATF